MVCYNHYLGDYLLMKNIVFYKMKRFNDHWTVAFMQAKDNNITIIKDDIAKLKEFLRANRDSILIGANNYAYDDVLMTSLVKNGNLFDDVSSEDITAYLPITLDLTQGIVRNYLVDYNNMVCNIWDENGNILPYHYALSDEDIVKQLVQDLEIIKGFYQMDDRRRFLNWKCDLIQEHGLPKSAYRESYGDIMKEILGLRINEEARVSRRIALDRRLKNALDKKNDSYLNDLYGLLLGYYTHIETIDKLKLKIGDCLVKFNEQGILGSVETDYIDTDEKNGSEYLYIDFNSFGPNILINNDWLNQIASHPEKYQDVKDRRIALKKDKQIEQLYYKYLLNSGLDYLNKVNTKNGVNVGLSLTVSGIMTMMLLYRNIAPYGIDLIECNTDGLIVKCPKKAIAKIKEEVRKLEEELALSCDVDVVKKIVHFNTMSYVIEFEDGTNKHLGDFGSFQTHPLYNSGITAVEKALRDYYLEGIPVSVTLRNLRNEGDLKDFQFVKKQKRNEKPKYVKSDDGYALYDRSTVRLFALREDALTNPFYVVNPKGLHEVYKTKRGRSVKEGYYYFQLADTELPNIHDIDLDYYINECYKVINKHPRYKSIQIMSETQKRNCFIDLDGTLIFDMNKDLSYKIFYDSVKDLIPDRDIQIAYRLFNEQKGCYLVQFLGVCKKFKGYGTIDNFAKFLQDKNLFPGQNYEVYRQFVINFLNNDRDYSSQLEAFNDSKGLLDYLHSDGFNIYLYSNWYKSVQEAKLESHGFVPYFSALCTIDDYYAKSSVKGWQDLLVDKNISSDDFNIMIGNGSNDIVPKSLRIPSIIVNHTNKENAKVVLSNGIIINSFQEVTNPNFISEIEEFKKLTFKR